jgi:hypothetical protein
MKYYISVGDTTNAFEFSRDAFEAGQATGQPFVVVRSAGGSLSIGVPYAIVSLTPYKGQDGVRRTMWNVTYLA